MDKTQANHYLVPAWKYCFELYFLKKFNIGIFII